MKKQITKNFSKPVKSRKRGYGYLLSKPAYFGDKNIPTAIELIQYDSQHLDIKNIPVDSSLKKSIDAKKINWFKITGIADAENISRICHEFGLHGFDIKDLLADQQVAKAVSYDDISYIMMSSFYHDDTTMRIDDMQIAFILGENFVVSFQEAQVPVFDEVKKEIKDNNISIRQKGADYLLYILLNSANLSNINTMMTIEDRLTDVENKLIMQDNSVDILQFIHTCRVNYMHVKRSVVSLREEYSNLLRNENNLIKDESIIYFEDFDDRLRTTIGNLSSFHETLTSLSDLYYNNNNMRMNEIIKRLTIVSTIFIPLTFMVGVWGMNFKFMPETDWVYGYLVAWITLISIAVFTSLWIRRQKWF